MTTAYYTHAACKGHDMGPGHPECPQRLDAIADHLLATGLDLALDFREAPRAAIADLERAHTAAYVRELKAAFERAAEEGRPIAFDPDTSGTPATFEAALRAAGAAVAATDAVIDGDIENAFCAVRPPGHHATRDQTMGFCFFNNVCVAARHALDVRGLERVAIFDFDVHHGNGTEDIVAGDERVLMLSFFQHPLYPGNGAVPLGTNMVNVPVPPYSKGPEICAMVEQMWRPRLADFRPQMVFVSAGFDAHREDDMGQLGLVESDYAALTQFIKRVADEHAGGRLVSCLEVGYSLSALARSVAAHLRVLAEVHG